jgi:isopenicillin-N epimerase
VHTDIGWRLDPAVTYLNHGSYGACPEPVLAFQRAMQDRMEAEPVRFLSGDLPGLLDAARADVGAFLGADPDGLAFVPNATTGVNTVLRSLGFEPGDELLTTDHEYNATLNALAAVAARDGARVVVARIPFPIAGPGDAAAAILAAATSRTRFALISHVTSPTALVLPVAEIVDELRRRGIETLVDGAHAPGMIPLDLDRLGAAWWTGNGHKWLCSPKGSAVLWVRADRREVIHPLVVSHGANEVLDGRTRFRAEFDWVGTSDPTAFLTLPAAIDWMAGSQPGGGGWPAIMTANHDLAIAGRDLVAEALGIAPPAPDSMLGSMAALPVPWLRDDASAGELSRRLESEDGIQVPVGGWPVRAARQGEDPEQVLIRISAQRYNELGDYERLADALARERRRTQTTASYRRWEAAE